MLFGTRDSFAIEAEPDPHSRRWGRLRIWADCTPIGNFDSTETIELMRDVFEGELLYIIPDGYGPFAGKDSHEVMDCVYHPKLGPSQRLSQFLIGRGLGPVFDGWYVLARAEGDRVRMIWRYCDEQEVHDAVLEPNAFEMIVGAFIRWCDEYLRSGRDGDK